MILPDATEAAIETILLVDDCEPLREIYSFLLRQAGLSVVEASNGKDALEVAEKVRPALVITDLNMPEMNGIELTRQLRGSLIHKNTPIVMFSSEATDAIRKEAEKAGIDQWISKSLFVPPEKMIEVAQSFVGRENSRMQ